MSKPAILQENRFVVEEGILYRATRTGAIWMNKLFFSSLVLLGVWLLWGMVGGDTGCVSGVPQAPTDPSQGAADAGTTSHCSVFLTPTAKFLGAMAIVSFALSIAFGALGLVVGKRIVAAQAAEEVGARREEPGT